MPLIKKQVNLERVAVQGMLAASDLELLDKYAAFIGSPRSYVVGAAIVHVMTRDKEFQASLKNGAETPVAKRTRRATTNGGQI